ncbi:MAG: peptide chain release factor N(5)-glutamine methyltransferase [Acidobacteria bacterium]|nr:peptide chain release factor N(5)-glutamine methyltransferase [Acidobacteriota bacterium]
MTVLDEVRAAHRRLVTAGVRQDDAASDAEVLARHALGWDRATYLTRRREPPPDRFAADYRGLVGRRARREPVSAITGRREFWGLTFEVGPAVLTPRPESELIVEWSLRLVGARRGAGLRVVDVGTGSGCLAVALARELPAARVVASDVSADAVAVARRNARTNGVAERIRWVVMSLLDGFRDAAPPAGRGADLIVANLPYVPSAATRVLSPEVRDHEPWVALDGGRDGLDPLRALLAAAPGHLAAGGHLVVEFGAGQEDTVRSLVGSAPRLTLLDVAGDLAGIPRVAAIRRR